VGSAIDRSSGELFVRSIATERLLARGEVVGIAVGVGRLIALANWTSNCYTKTSGGIILLQQKKLLLKAAKFLAQSC
jgi:hypothetical protein